MKNWIPTTIHFALNTLNMAGFEAYVVGGCVRDFLMGIPPHDFDITTSATPEEIINSFNGYYTILTGIKHGTVIVVFDGEGVEITTFRKDGEYTDHRHPDQVEFTPNLKEDLARRDFTINTLAYNPKIGIIDCYNGKQDIEQKTIKCVGDATTRFGEDALRILRGIRFSSTLGFQIETKTAQSMEQCKHLIQNVSAERIFVEFRKLLMGKNVEEVLLNYHSIIATFIPEIVPCIGFDQKNPYHKYDVYRHIVCTVSASVPNEYIRIAMFFHDIGKPCCYTEENGRGHFYGHSKISKDIAQTVLKRLKADNKTIAIVATLVHLHDMQINLTEKSIRKILQKIGPELFFMLLDVKRADNKGKSEALWDRQENFDKASKLAQKILSENQCVGLKSLNINGNDIIKLGITEGKMIGKILAQLLDCVMEETVENEKETLIKYIKENILKN